MVSILSGAEEDCMACHEDPDLKSKDEKPLFVDGEKSKSSIHGAAGISCTDCHIDLQGFDDFPHPERLQQVNCGSCHSDALTQFQSSVHSSASPPKDCCTVSCKDCHGKHDIKPKDDYNSRVFSLNLPETCEKCHLEKVKTARGAEFIKRYEKSIHYKGLEEAGLATSSNCSNCHGYHDIKKVQDPSSKVSRKNIVQTCGKCHIGIKIDYLEGVHGKDYLKGINDVPVCTDCHSEHAILPPEDTGSGVYATKVASICTRCHDDEVLSKEYGFISSRLKTYSGSIHGIASRFGEIRVANCASCHGFHGIRPSSDPKSTIYSENIPKTCGKCHPGAGKNFAKGRIHVVSEKRSNRWAYFAKIFYTIFISGIVVVFLVFITADMLHRLSRKKKCEINRREPRIK